MTEGERIVSLEEKMRNIEDKVDRGFENTTKQIEEIKTTLKDFIKGADERYVTEVEFSPIRKIVYGAVALILTAVLATILILIGLKTSIL